MHDATFQEQEKVHIPAPASSPQSQNPVDAENSKKQLNVTNQGHAEMKTLKTRCDKSNPAGFHFPGHKRETAATSDQVNLDQNVNKTADVEDQPVASSPQLQNPLNTENGEESSLILCFSFSNNRDIRANKVSFEMRESKRKAIMQQAIPLIQNTVRGRSTSSLSKPGKQSSQGSLRETKTAETA